MIMWTQLHNRLSSALRTSVNISNMDKFVVKSKRPADVEDSNCRKMRQKNTQKQPSTSTPAVMAKSTVRDIHLAIRTTAFICFTCPWQTVDYCLQLKMLFQQVSSTYQTHARYSQCIVLTVPLYGLICSYTDIYDLSLKIIEICQTTNEIASGKLQMFTFVSTRNTHNPFSLLIHTKQFIYKNSNSHNLQISLVSYNICHKVNMLYHFFPKRCSWSPWSRLLLQSLHIQWYLKALDIVLTIDNCLTFNH